MVSGPKVRYTAEGYNLDFTYVTPRVIAMSFPAAGLESFYRNSIDDVILTGEKIYSSINQIFLIIIFSLSKGAKGHKQKPLKQLYSD